MTNIFIANGTLVFYKKYILSSYSTLKKISFLFWDLALYSFLSELVCSVNSVVLNSFFFSNKNEKKIFGMVRVVCEIITICWYTWTTHECAATLYSQKNVALFQSIPGPSPLYSLIKWCFDGCNRHARMFVVFLNKYVVESWIVFLVPRFALENDMSKRKRPEY